MADNRIQLNIAGMTLLITTQEDEEYVRKLADMIERDMQEVLSQNTGASVANTAILCSLDYLDRYHKANRSAANMRAQIKEYLTDAANAKLLFDGEKKRADALAEELKNLRGQSAQRADDDRRAAAAQHAAAQEELAAGTKELDGLRREYETVAAQCKSLTDRIRALNDYITNQDNEISRLKGVENEQNDTIQSQTKKISQLEDTVSDKQARIEQLVTELKSLEKIVSNDMTSPSKKIPTSAPAARRDRDSDSVRSPFEDESFPRYDSKNYGDSGDMPDLSWTKEI